MKSYRFKSLDIISARKPKNTHLFFETSAGGLYIVDSVDDSKVYYSSYYDKQLIINAD